MENEWTREIELLKAENEKLRGLLKRFTSLCPNSEGLGGHAPMYAFSTLAHIVRKALEN